MANLISRLRGGLKKTLFATVLGLTLFSCDYSHNPKPENPVIERPKYNGPKTKIAFLEYNSKEDTKTDLWIINSDGSELKKIFDGAKGERIQFSPNGEYLAFIGSDKKHKITDLEGNLIAEFDNKERSEEDFTWTPDGNSILYGTYGYGGGTEGIYKYDLLTKSNQQLLKTIGFTYDHNPVMSPNLKKIIFTHTESESWYNLKVMNADGTNLELITEGISNEYDEQLELNWLDNENIIWKVYSANPEGYTLHTCNLLTKEVKKINPNAGYGAHIELTNDKKTLVNYGLCNEGDVYLINVNELSLGINKKLEIDAWHVGGSPDGNYFMTPGIKEELLSIYDKNGDQYKGLIKKENFPEDFSEHAYISGLAWSSKVLQ
jgi:WD40 repeat protein